MWHAESQLSWHLYLPLTSLQVGVASVVAAPFPDTPVGVGVGRRRSTAAPRVYTFWCVVARGLGSGGHSHDGPGQHRKEERQHDVGRALHGRGVLRMFSERPRRCAPKGRGAAWEYT